MSENANRNPLFSKSIPKTVITKEPFSFEVSPWKVLVVDDEPEVHKVTKMVLRGFTLNGRPIAMVNAYSAHEARRILKKDNDFALCLIDVVMETDEAGLELVKYIRNELQNTNVRLVLRTGQPGYAPEQDVIRDYDINDYKDKTELTNTKLHTLMCSAFRAYDDIITLEMNRIGLEGVIKASAKIFEAGSLKTFTSAVLMQLMSLLHLSKNAVMLKASGFSATGGINDLQILAGVGEFADLTAEKTLLSLSADVKQLLQRALTTRRNIYEKRQMVLFSETQEDNHHHLLYVQHHQELSDLDKSMIELFCSNVSIAFENQTLKAELEETQREIVCILGEAIENRSKESGNHIYRVAQMMYIVAIAYGFSHEEAERIKAAAPLHDVGKVGIPDAVLHKPGKLNEDEWLVMKTHVDMGHDMLKSSQRKILQYASIIAREHHERWDGTGYPLGLAGEEIHILGRMSSVVDVFDALTSTRCYKKAWTITEAVEYLKKQSGSQFDPNIVNLFLENLDEIKCICEQYSSDPEPASNKH